jgi:hypothetical protein
VLGLRTAACLAIAGVSTLVAAVGSAAFEAGAVVDVPAVRRDPNDRALLVSDSAWLGIRTYGAVDSVQGFEHVLDLASCRRRVTDSCRHTNGFAPITLYDELVWRGGSFNTLIVATGYNDSDHNFEADVDTLVALARTNGYDRIVWLTLRSNVAYTSPGDLGYAAVFERNNASLQALVASGEYPEIVIANWSTYARDRPTWFASDGIHLRGEGPWAAGDYVSRKLAFLDGRACPQPIAAGQAPHDPCPDPDATGHIVDLESVYPVGQPYPYTPFALEWEGASSWPGAPWWQS